jgi:hypothetical protein
MRDAEPLLYMVKVILGCEPEMQRLKREAEQLQRDIEGYLAARDFEYLSLLWMWMMKRSVRLSIWSGKGEGNGVRRIGASGGVAASAEKEGVGFAWGEDNGEQHAS